MRMFVAAALMSLVAVALIVRAVVVGPGPVEMLLAALLMVGTVVIERLSLSSGNEDDA